MKRIHKEESKSELLQIKFVVTILCHSNTTILKWYTQTSDVQSFF